MKDLDAMTDQEWGNALRRVRRAAVKEFHSIHKQRGGFGLMIVDASCNMLVAGEGFQLDLNDVAEYFNVTI